jgi:hypothetical protein
MSRAAASLAVKLQGERIACPRIEGASGAAPAYDDFGAALTKEFARDMSWLRYCNRGKGNRAD